MKSLLLSLLACCLCFAQAIANPPAPFAVVLIDAHDEQQLGGFPLPREMMAQGIDAIAAQEPRAIIFKFFIDLPKPGPGDAALAESVARAPVVLQARIDASEPNPNPLPEKFFLPDIPDDWSISVVGDTGWIPLPILSQHALAVGFAEHMHPTAAPILERFQGKAVKSLYLIGLEQAFGAEAKLTQQSLSIDGHTLRIGPSMLTPVQYPQIDDLPYTSFTDLIAGKTAPNAFKDKVVIFGYDGEKMHTFDTPVGELKAHRMYCYALFDLYRKMQSAE